MRELFRIVRVAWSARRIQDFLWHRPGEPIEDGRSIHDWKKWVDNLQLRLDRIESVDPHHVNWRVEAKKRLLQLATVSIAMMEAIDRGKIEPK